MVCHNDALCAYVTWHVRIAVSVMKHGGNTWKLNEWRTGSSWGSQAEKAKRRYISWVLQDFLLDESIRGDLDESRIGSTHYVLNQSSNHDSVSIKINGCATVVGIPLSDSIRSETPCRIHAFSPLYWFPDLSKIITRCFFDNMVKSVKVEVWGSYGRVL